MFLEYGDRLVALIEEDKRPKLLWEIRHRHAGPPDRSCWGRRTLSACIAATAILHCLDAPPGKQVWSPAAVGEPLGYAVPQSWTTTGSTFESAPHEGGLSPRRSPKAAVQKPQFFRSRQELDSPAHGCWTAYSMPARR